MGVAEIYIVAPETRGSRERGHRALGGPGRLRAQITATTRGFSHLDTMSRSRCGVTWLVSHSLGLAGVLLLGQGCQGDDMVAPRTGEIAVTVTTDGPEPDPDGYTLSLDGRQGVVIGASATRILQVDAGRHVLKLAGLAANCAVAGDGPTRTVTIDAEATVPVLFEVECHATAGGIRVIISTTGNVADPDGYTVALDEESPRPVAVEDTLELTALVVGDHLVRLLEVADACAVTGGDTQTVAVTAGLMVDVRFEVICQTGVERWSPMASGSEADLTDVWGTSPSDVFTVGELATDDGNGFQLASAILHFDGTGWSLQRRIRDVSLHGVWGTAPDDVWAVGFDFFDDDARVLHYDGTEWASQEGFEAGPEESIGLLSVWGSSSSDVFAVGSTFDGEFDVSLIFHYDGAGWQRMAVAGDVLPSLSDVWGSSSSDVFAVGIEMRADPSEGTVLHYDGSGWTPIYRESGLTLNTVWGSSATDVFVAGFTIREDNDDVGAVGEVRHFDGTGWSPVTIPAIGALNELWGNSATDVFAVGDDGVILHYDGTLWTATNPTDQTLLGVWTSGPAEAFATGIAGTILHGTP
jgi:hypothetical protein